MLTPFKSLKAGEFFVYKLEEGISIYQKISPYDHYNCVLLNTGQICNIYEDNTKVEKVKIELKIKYDE